MQTSIVWLRADLRLNDNPALFEVSKLGPLVPLYIWDPQVMGKWSLGAASRWWLHHSLGQLQKQFAEKNIPLIIRQGNSLQVLRNVLKECNAKHVVWNRCYEPEAIAHDAAVKAALQKEGIQVQTYRGSLLFEPWTVANKQGKPFQVFTPFWKYCLSQAVPEAPLSTPPLMKQPVPIPVTETLSSLKLLPSIPWDAGLQEAWQPGELSAQKLLSHFLQNGIVDYGATRDIPGCEGVSRLSPYLHFGEISPRTVWKKVRESCDPQVADTYLRQLGWREFAYHLLYHFPKTPEQPLRKEFANFPWDNNPCHLLAWQKGYTGYPIIDAGMRQLWHTGWMHNRVRMIVGSFLVKDLLISWKEGAKWFWDTLVDADLANNTLGWQWVGGCGADAAPYFRVFNPVLQGEKFDPEGVYVKKWVPELEALPVRWIHRPWEAPDAVIWQAGISHYPKPVVDHKAARQRALAAFAQIRQDRAIMA